MKKLLLPALTIYLSIFLLFSCRTTSLNQTAEVLPQGTHEVVGTAGTSVALTYNLPAFITNIGVQTRHGVNGMMEYQTISEVGLYFEPIKNYTEISTVFDNQFKFKLHEDDIKRASIMFSFGTESLFSNFYKYSLSYTTGFKFVGDYKTSENTRFYYGPRLSITGGVFYSYFPNFPNSKLNEYNSSYPAIYKYPFCYFENHTVVPLTPDGATFFALNLPVIETGFTWGYEIKSPSIIQRHEFALGLIFNLMGNEYGGIYAGYLPEIYTGYSIALGKIVSE